MVMKMLRNGYGMIMWSCYCSLWVPVVVRWWVLVCCLYLKSLCLETSYTVEGSYSGGGHGGQSSYGGYSGDSGEADRVVGYSGVLDGGRYTDGGLYGGYSGGDRYSYGSTGHSGDLCKGYERCSYGGSV